MVGFPGGSVLKILPADAVDIGNVGLIPGSGSYPGVGNGNPLQNSFLGQRSLVGYSPWGPEELDTAEQMSPPIYNQYS